MYLTVAIHEHELSDSLILTMQHVACTMHREGVSEAKTKEGGGSLMRTHVAWASGSLTANPQICAAQLGWHVSALNVMLGWQCMCRLTCRMAATRDCSSVSHRLASHMAHCLTYQWL